VSTRTKIIVKGGKFSLILYRHYDGYPAETGAHLLETPKACGMTGDLSRRHPDDCAASFVNRLLRTHCADSFGNGGVRFEYEVTTEIHGDIEHLYRVEFTNGGQVKVSHRPIDIGQADQGDSVLVSGLVSYSLTQFADMVNTERAGINARMRARGMPESDALQPVTI
jgi:hypothetical protein